ncbi:hypothetical protein J3E07_001670 [Methanococcus voltae]|uniref:Uncharacterized protein n=1 Tax=Methanococcus voltae TaxID=2188 RepID=A0A8J7RGY3_METVO|nr:hypothetical protein [Methanococcus voltae]MBP2202229.1 hypothetical protein [Methanococcus voltae]
MGLIILDFEMRYYKGHVKIILSITIITLDKCFYNNNPNIYARI